MKRLKQILTMSMIMAVILVPMVVFADGEYFIGGYGLESKGHIEVSNYKEELPGMTERIHTLHWDKDSPYDGSLDHEDANHNEIIHKAVVTSGKTTLTLKTEQGTPGSMTVYPILSKINQNTYVVKPDVDFGHNETKVVLDAGEYIIQFLMYDKNSDPAWASGYLKVETEAETGLGLVKPQKPATTKLGVGKTTARSTSSKVLVNNKSVTFEAYNINASNYIKLRDFAAAVKGTSKQFDVVWDTEKGAINLVSNGTYPGKIAKIGEGGGKKTPAILNQSRIYQDGVEVNLMAYTINDNNFFKLRDLAKAFAIEVTYDEATATIKINTI